MNLVGFVKLTPCFVWHTILWEISGLAFSWSLQGSQMVFFDGHWPFVPGNGTVFLVSKIGSPVDV